MGSISPEAERLINTTRESLYEGIRAAVAGGRIGDISSAVQRYCEERGFSVVRDYVGHGVGAKLHEDPSVPNFGTPGRGVRLLPGMTIAIEPMINMDGPSKRRTAVCRRILSIPSPSRTTDPGSLRSVEVRVWSLKSEALSAQKPGATRAS